MKGWAEHLPSQKEKQHKGYEPTAVQCVVRVSYRADQADAGEHDQDQHDDPEAKSKGQGNLLFYLSGYT